MLFVTGVYWISRKNVKIKQYDGSYPDENYLTRNELKDPPFLISNHIGLLDAFAIGSTSFVPSFVAKNFVKKIPIIGSSARLS